LQDHPEAAEAVAERVEVADPVDSMQLEARDLGDAEAGTMRSNVKE
jgi:hypothetical protein